MSDQTKQFSSSHDNWQQQLADAFTDIESLCKYLELSPNALPISKQAAARFPLRVPLGFAACMEKGNPNDPLLRQVLPLQQELTVYPGFSDDPVGDLAASSAEGVIHKYQGRVLLINTGSCAIHCRYCFRRNFPYQEMQLGKQKELDVIQNLQTSPDISEVILSGGDPLLLSDARLEKLIRQLDCIGHIKRIRIHSRLPIVLPARITKGLIELLQASSKQILIVTHCNHCNELSTPVVQACQRLKAAGIVLFNQAVLLKGINDNVETLCELSETLFDHGVIPYYLHLLDRANGTGHFEVTETDALALIRQVQAALPGYMVPKLVKEQAGAASKLQLHY